MAEVLEPDLLREWDRARDQLPGAARKRLRAVGVSLEAEMRAGGLGFERIATVGGSYLPDPAGFGALIIPVYSGEPPSIYGGDIATPLVDMVALRTEAPDRWWRRAGTVYAVLNLHLLDLAHATGRSITLHPDPLSWLRAECCGACLVEWLEACAVAAAAEPLEAAA